MSLRKNLTLKNLTLEKQCMKLINYKKDKLHIKKIISILFYSLYKNNYFNMDISRSSFSGIPPLQLLLGK